MSFLDEQTVTTDDERRAANLAKQGVNVKLVDKVSEKKGRDMDGDGDVDSDDYLAARDAAIKKAKAKKRVNEKEYGQDTSLDKFKAIQPGTEVQYMGSTFKVKSNDGFTLDLENGQKINYAMFNKKGRIPEGKQIKIDPNQKFIIDLKHLMQKHSKDDTIKITKKLMDKLHDKGEVEVDGTKLLFKENLNEEKYIVTISKNGTTTETNVHNTKEDAEAQAKKINGGYMDRPDAKFKAIVSKDVNEADVPMDMPVDLPEPETEKPRRKGSPRLVAFDTDQDSHYLGDDDYDYEGGMAKSQMLKMKNYAKALCDMIEDESQLEAWVQAKLTKASDYMSSVYHYLDYQRSKMDESTLNEITKQEFEFPNSPEGSKVIMKTGEYPKDLTAAGSKAEPAIDFVLPSSNKYRDSDNVIIYQSDLEGTEFKDIDTLFNAFKKVLGQEKGVEKLNDKLIKRIIKDPRFIKKAFEMNEINENQFTPEDYKKVFDEIKNEFNSDFLADLFFDGLEDEDIKEFLDLINSNAPENDIIQLIKRKGGDIDAEETAKASDYRLVTVDDKTLDRFSKEFGNPNPSGPPYPRDLIEIRKLNFKRFLEKANKDGFFIPQSMPIAINLWKGEATEEKIRLLNKKNGDFAVK